MATLRIEIFPDNLDLAASFYRDVLGFTLVRDERKASAPYITLRLGEVRVGAAERPPLGREQRRPPLGVELVLEVDGLSQARQRVQECGWPIEEDVTVRPWGLTDFRILDPFGYYWRLTEPEQEPAGAPGDGDL
jgi:uncharacterized glyoxalase superfamily protein PhnB